MKTAKYRSPKGKPHVDPMAVDGHEWVVVNGFGRNEDDDGQLGLKKQVWMMRICQRKTAASVACQLEDQGQEMDAETVEALCSEVEVLRASLGMHWTWFQEELLAGRYDTQLSGEASGGHSLENVLLPPSADATLAACPLDPSVAKVCKNRRSPNSSAKSTPKMQSKLSPQSGTRSPQFQVEKKIEIPKEVWLAAEKHRKSNFFRPALLESSEGCGALFILLTFMEVSDALSLALASAAFLASLLDRASNLQQDSELESGLPKDEVWRLLGSRGICPGFTNDSFVAFASDPAFRCHVWARQQRFFDRLLRGLAKTAEVLPSVQDLGGPGTTLGPFLPPSASCLTGCSRLVVCDGKQTCRVVDVVRLREEQVEIDRYCSKRQLLSSLGAHPQSVTTSWPLNEVPHCCAGGGIIAARPAPTTGILPRSSATLQWLELPEFDRFSLHANNATSDDCKVAHGANCTSPSLSKPHSPSLASAKTSPVLSRQKSPTMKASPLISATLKNDAVPMLARTSFLQEQLLAIVPDGKEAPPPSCVVVEGAWPLPGRQVLLTVREVLASSPSLGPMKSPQFRASTSPKGLLAEAMRSTGPAPAPFELPPEAAAVQLPRIEDQACQGLRRWLQVWDLVADGKEAPEARACMALTSQVTCVDILGGLCARGQANTVPLFLCGSSGGTVFLQSIEEVQESRASWTVEANFGNIVKVLLRPGCQKDAGDVLAVVAQEHGVFLGTANAKVKQQPAGTLTKLLPIKAIAASLNVASLQPVGACGFAVCSMKHVYAFQVEAGNAVLAVTVELPGIPVRHFCATPYEFFVVLAGECSQKRRTVCCLWPTFGEVKATRSCAAAVNLHAKVQGPEGELQDTMAVAVDLSKVLLHGASIDALALNAVLPGQAGPGLLAVLSVGSGVSVFRWGTEVSPELQRIRDVRAECEAQQAHEHRLEILRRQLQRLQQRIQETEKLEEKAQTKGSEALTEEEKAKIQRRGQVEAEIDRLTHELGMDAESQDEEEEMDPQEERDMEIARHRREKERIQRRHHEDKRALQKERRQNRERKFSE